MTCSERFRTILQGFALDDVEFMHEFVIRSVTVGPKMLLGSLPNDVYSHHLSEAESAGVEKMATDGG